MLEKDREPGEEGRVITPSNPALGTDYIEVYGRCKKKLPYLQPVTSDEEMPPGNERMHYREQVNSFLFFYFLFGTLVIPQCHCSLVNNFWSEWSQYYQPCESFGEQISC